MTELTDSSNNLRLHSKLALKATREIADASLTIGSHIWHFPDVVEHVSGGEEKHCNQADGCPEVAALNHRQKVWASHCEKGQTAEDCNSRRCNLDVVDWADHWRMWTTRQ